MCVFFALANILFDHRLNRMLLYIAIVCSGTCVGLLEGLWVINKIPFTKQSKRAFYTVILAVRRPIWAAYHTLSLFSQMMTDNRTVGWKRPKHQAPKSALNIFIEV